MTGAVRPKRNGSLDERCAWVRMRQAEMARKRPSSRWVGARAVEQWSRQLLKRVTNHA
jgi:hypothetical protein